MDFNIEALNWDNESRIKMAKIIAEEIRRYDELLTRWKRIFYYNVMTTRKTGGLC